MNIKSVTKKITDKYSEESILERVNDQIIAEYVDDEWAEEGFDSEYDWYKEHCSDEAESDILNEVIQEHCGDIKISDNDYLAIFESLKEFWNL